MKNMINRKIKEKLIEGFFFLNGIIVILILGGIFILLLKNALPAFREVSVVHFLTKPIWNPDAYAQPTYGLLPMFVSSMMVTLGSLIVAVPLGIGTAAYLSDVASPRVREFAKPAVEVLAGIPSVVVGFLGIVLVGPMITKLTGTYNGLNALNGSILLAVMALPTIISLSEDALTSVPRSYEEASLALGANKWQTVIRVKIPAAASGILAACMLGMGRAIGETMTVLMATGNAAEFPHSFLGPVKTMTSTIAIELGEVAYYTTHFYMLFAVGLMLFIITFIINLVSDIVFHKHTRIQ
ncbi:MAG: phosphate ABC transporter permease subunit PstC [Candidatus Omnitrophica bacterium]|nr:phosphate ABC transporter permease subunit PstC [Candidatus Omnitrophota bacterium]